MLFNVLGSMLPYINVTNPWELPWIIIPIGLVCDHLHYEVFYFVFWIDTPFFSLQNGYVDFPSTEADLFVSDIVEAGYWMDIVPWVDSWRAVECVGRLLSSKIEGRNWPWVFQLAPSITIIHLWCHDVGCTSNALTYSLFYFVVLYLSHTNRRTSLILLPL